MDDTMMAGQSEQAARPEPTTIDEALSRVNRPLPQLRETCSRLMQLGGPREYDQGDAITVPYDALVDVISGFRALARLCEKNEEVEREAT